MHHVVTPGFEGRHRWSDGTAGHMDGEAGWWTTSGKIGLPPLTRIKGVGRQQQGSREWVDNNKVAMATLPVKPLVALMTVCIRKVAIKRSSVSLKTHGMEEPRA